MNPNLSAPQFKGTQSMTQDGAMPLNSKFEDHPLAEVSGSQNNFAANINKPLAKPGFFQ